MSRRNTAELSANQAQEKAQEATQTEIVEEVTTGDINTATGLREAVVYIGPSLPGVMKYTVYRNGIPGALAAKVKENPVYGSFIVPVSRMASAGAELAKEGSALHTLYKKIEKER